MAESNLRRALTLSQGDASIFFTRPISLLFIVLTIASFLWPLWTWWRGAKQGSGVPAALEVESME
jgi:putative tricarboxylic transport membrane protein